MDSFLKEYQKRIDAIAGLQVLRPRGGWHVSVKVASEDPKVQVRELRRIQAELTALKKVYSVEMQALRSDFADRISMQSYRPSIWGALLGARHRGTMRRDAAARRQRMVALRDKTLALYDLAMTNIDEMIEQLTSMRLKIQTADNPAPISTTRGISHPFGSHPAVRDPGVASTSLARTLHDPDGRQRQLEQYLDAHVLQGRHFLCPSFKECRDSHPSDFYHGQLHHVGSHYDLLADGHPFRVAVVGQEYGGPPSCVSLSKRSGDIAVGSGRESRFKADGVHPPRNPHMRGTTSVLRLLFGIPLGTDHEREFIVVDRVRVHLFDAFALTNYLLCSAVSPGSGSEGKSTIAMRRNCRTHFRRTLEILAPTIIIVQGLSFWPSVKAAFDSVAQLNGPLHEARLGKNPHLVAVFSHPSAPGTKNWGMHDHTDYLLEVVVPTVREIRNQLLG